MNYHFSIAGIRIRCEIPYELNISESTKPFVSDDTADVELVFRFYAVKHLISDDTKGVWQAEHCYHEDDDGFHVYHCHLDFDKPYAKVYWHRNMPRVLHCDYVQGQEARISNTRNIIHLMGLETFLLMHEALLMHASFIRVKGHGILFTAPSGTGKSTQADLWREFEGADILNGDRSALRRSAERWLAWGLPYAGSSGIYRNESAQLSAIVVLRQAKENKIRRLNASESLRYIYPEISIHRWDPEFVDKAVNLYLDLASSVPIFLLECLPDQSAVQLLKDTLMKGGELL